MTNNIIKQMEKLRESIEHDIIVQIKCTKHEKKILRADIFDKQH